MELRKVVIKDNFNDFLNGKEVEAALLPPLKNSISPGEHVLAFKDSIAATTNVSVPKEEMHRTIGVEGTVVSTSVKTNPSAEGVRVKIKKI